MKYKIYGHWLRIDTDDEILINALQNCVGHFAETDSELIGKVHFAKISVKQLNNYEIPIDGMIITSSFVQPTKEFSTVYRCLSGKKVIHFYESYYLIEYMYDSNSVLFYYTQNFYDILDLMGEFLKYYIFEKAFEYSLCPVHSSCVLNNESNKCVIFVGDSGCGKSSNALFSSLKRNFDFLNDEITYISNRDGHLAAIPTTDKFKICKPMFLELKGEVDVICIENNEEYICDFKNYDIRAAKIFDIECIVALVRDDRLERIEKNGLSKLELYNLILRNFHFSLCNTKESKRLVIDCVSKVIQNCNVISLRYPTKLIREINKYI